MLIDEKNTSKKNEIYIKDRVALKSGVWYTISNFFAKGILFLTTPIFARLLTQYEFGTFNNYTSWLSIITIFITLNLDSTLISARFEFERDFDCYILSVLLLGIINVFTWGVIFTVGRDYFSSFMDLDTKYIYAMLLYLFFLPPVTMLQTREAFLFKYKKNVLISLILSMGSALLSVLLVSNMSNKLDGRIIGTTAPTIILGMVALVFFYKKGKKIKIIYWKYAIPICLPYIPHLLSMTLLNSTDRVMITKICGSEQTALYSLAYSCGTMVTLLLTSLNSAFAPWLGERINRNEYSEVRKFSYTYVSFFLLFAIGIMLMSPEILYILGGESYMEAVYVMAPVSMGCVCQFLYTMFVNVEQFKKKTVGMAIGSAVAAVVNLILNLLFIPRFGYLAAAYTTLVGYIVLLFIHMYLVKRLNLQEIYDYKFICMVVVVGVILMVLVTILYSHTVIRYCVVVVYGSFLICYLIKNNSKILCFLKR